MSGIRKTAVIVAALCAPAAGAASGDVIIKNDGQKVVGQVVAEGDTEVTVQTNVGAIVLRQKMLRSEIKEIQKEAIAENRFCRIPIHGEIGTEVRADWLAKAMDQAAGLNANYLVFDFDSPGGDVSEMTKIVELLKKQTRFHKVAVIKRALSAGAIIALSCETILVEPGASIGAAVPWRFGPKGTPEDVEAKFLSAFRAYAKSTAEMSHHSPLLASGMIDLKLVLSVSPSAGGTPVVAEGMIKDAFILKKSGEILCLSANDAIICGLAAGSVLDIAGVQSVLKLKDWASVGDAAWAYMESRTKAEKPILAAKQQAAEISQRDQLEALLEKANARMNELNKSKEEAQSRLNMLPREQNAEISKINANLPLVEREMRLAEINNHFKTMTYEAQQTIVSADLELKDLLQLKTNIHQKLAD